MHITVEQALTIYPLSEGKLIAGKSGTSRVVKSVNVMDAPDITDWIKDGEMLFTTAYLIKDNPDDAIHLLRKLNQRGSAGLGIKLGRFWSRVPEEIMEEADRLSFPLIELPFQFTFSDQMNGLFNAEMQRNTKVLHSVLDKQKKLMQFALKPDPLKNFFHAILGIIGYPLAVIGTRGHVLFNSTPLDESKLTRQWPWKETSQWVYTEEGRYFRIPLTQREECIGYVLFYPTEDLLMKVEEGLFYQAAEIISYHMGHIYKEYTDQSVQNDLGTLMVRYLKGSHSIEALTEEAERLGIRLLPDSFQCMLTILSENAGAAEKERLLRGVREELQYLPELKDAHVLHFYVTEGVLTIVAAEPFSGNNGLADIVASCVKDMREAQDGGLGLRIGISNKKSRPETLREAFRECAEACRIADKLGVREPVVQFETVELAYLFQHVPKDRMQMYCDEVLEPLLAKDPEYAREMLRTLETFLDHDGQVNETAKQLFIHRNTAAYRLEKISEILEVDYKKMNDLLRLKLVFVFRQMMGPSSY